MLSFTPLFRIMARESPFELHVAWHKKCRPCAVKSQTLSRLMHDHTCGRSSLIGSDESRSMFCIHPYIAKTEQVNDNDPLSCYKGNASMTAPSFRIRHSHKSISNALQASHGPRHHPDQSHGVCASRRCARFISETNT